MLEYPKGKRKLPHYGNLGRKVQQQRTGSFLDHRATAAVGVTEETSMRQNYREDYGKKPQVTEIETGGSMYNRFRSVRRIR